MIAAALLSGCAEFLPTMLPSEELATVQAGYGRAFGRVTYLVEGKEVEWSTFGFTMYVRGAQDAAIQSTFVEGNGEFNWPLRPGNYVLIGYLATDQGFVQQVRRTVRLWSVFTVPAAGSAVYIGELQIDPRASNVASLADRFDASVNVRGAALKQAGFQPVKGLMQPESRVESYQHVSGVCNEGAWGIKCNDEYQGLEPVSPEGTAQGYPVAQSLAPVLEWKPATNPNVSYDVVIYESYPASLSRPQLKGARVAYTEGLREPRFVPPQPLEPGRTYEWSVRAREGDTVSTWSSRSSNMVIKASRGDSFGFTTPAK